MNLAVPKSSARRGFVVSLTRFFHHLIDEYRAGTHHELVGTESKDVRADEDSEPMSITYQCGECGSWQEARDGQAGRTAKCPDCRSVNLIPKVSADAGLLDRSDSFADLRVQDGRGTSSTEPTNRLQAGPPRTSSWKASPPPQADSKKGGWSGGLGLLGFLAIIALRIYLRLPAQPRPRPQPIAPEQIIQKLLQPPTFPDPKVRIELPPLPDLGQGVEIEPGVILHEIRLGEADALPGNPPINAKRKVPGFHTQLWVYLPTGEVKENAKGADAAKPVARSLGCVLIAPAGTDLTSGIPLVRDDRAEHVPYVHAGFAVVAFDLDGYSPPIVGGGLSPIGPSNRQEFIRAEAGLDNARAALAFALAKVPGVDPKRIYVAGHSSAGTLAMLFAESDPRVKACLAYAPAIDLNQRLDPRATISFGAPARKTFIDRYSPRSLEAKLNVPLFLFAAKDDEIGSYEDAQAAAERLKAHGKTVTFVTVAEGGHYNSMIEVGMPRGIAWLKQLEAKNAAK